MIVDVFEAVKAHAQLTGVTVELGAEFNDELAEPPRIVWVPTVDSFEPGKRINTPGNGSNPARVADSVGTRWAGTRVRVWAIGDETPAGDIRAAEDLVRRFLVAVHELAFGSYRVQSLEWIGADGAEIVQRGRACDINIQFSVPTHRDAPTTATITVIESSGMEGTLVLPTGDVTATPSP